MLIILCGRCTTQLLRDKREKSHFDKGKNAFQTGKSTFQQNRPGEAYPERNLRTSEALCRKLVCLSPHLGNEPKLISYKTGILPLISWFPT